jgi:hypothetical protein
MCIYTENALLLSFAINILPGGICAKSLIVALAQSFHLLKFGSTLPVSAKWIALVTSDFLF